MTKQKQNVTRFEKTECGCAKTAAACPCGDKCDCPAPCQCGGGCACAGKR